MTEPAVDQVARDLATEAKAEVVSHEAVCVQRYAEINATLKDIRGTISWSTRGLICALVGAIGWLVSQQMQLIQTVHLEQVSRPQLYAPPGSLQPVPMTAGPPVSPPQQSVPQPSPAADPAPSTSVP